MRLRARLLRILRITAITLVAFVLLLFVFVQGEKVLLRHRAERLLADYKTLSLGHTSWPEAESFFRRWHHWGYASPSCTPAYCSYNIAVSDTISMHLPRCLLQEDMHFLTMCRAANLFSILGYRVGTIDATITIVNGVLLSDEIELYMVVPYPSKEAPYLLAMSARSQPTFGMEHGYDYDFQMRNHPDYLVGRPGGCEGCRVGWVEYAPRIRKDEYAQVTDFRLNCLSQWKPCEQPEDLLPMVAPYHLYENAARDAQLLREPPNCVRSSYTLGRDAYWVLVVDALSVKPHKLGEYEEHDGYEYGEHVKVSWVSVLKGDLPPQVKTTDTFMPYPGLRSQDVDEAPEHMVPGKRYILFWSAMALEQVGSLDRCGIIPDTPQNRADVMAGIQDDLKFESPRVNYPME
jgi:hypothetical protein